MHYKELRQEELGAVSEQAEVEGNREGGAEGGRRECDGWKQAARTTWRDGLGWGTLREKGMVGWHRTG